MSEPRLLPEEKYPQAAYALGQESAHPTQHQTRHDGEVLIYAQYGLTKRELFAAMAMQEIAPHIGEVFSQDFGAAGATKVARIAVRCADALLKELAK